jgi:hypothetical protein
LYRFSTRTFNFFLQIGGNTDKLIQPFDQFVSGITAPANSIVAYVDFISGAIKIVLAIIKNGFLS